MSIKDDNKLSLLKELIKQERSLEWLAKTLEVNSLEIMGEVTKLKDLGNNVLITKKNGKIFIINFGDFKLENDVFKINNNSNVIRFGLVSDTRFGSKYQQLSLLNEFYNNASNFEADMIIHLGDISEGIYSGKNSIYNDSLFLHGIEEQANYIIKSYPHVSGITTYFLTGEHDLTHMNKKNPRDIGKIISDGREDMIYLGPNQCNMEINNIKVYLEHMTSKRDQPLQLSYRPQETIRTIRSEDKVDYFFQGHNLYAQAFTQRNIKCITVPSMVATTPEIRSKSIYNTVGSWLVEIDLDDNGELIGNYYRFSPNYKTIDEDYKFARVLKKGGNK